MAKESLLIIVDGVQQRYTRRPIFQPISFQALPGEIIAITGPNGAGKTTLLKIIGDVLSPSMGTCVWNVSAGVLEHDGIQSRLGYVAPYLELYDELTAAEHVELVARFKGGSMARTEAVNWLEHFGIDSAVAHSDRRLRAYSSGMKQRVRCAMAFAGEPDALLLDEPTSTLDDNGTKIVLANARNAAKRGAIVFIATNDPREREIAEREICINAA